MLWYESSLNLSISKGGTFMIMKEQIEAMSVQFVQYSLDYTIDAYAKCGIKYMEFWGAEPH